MSPFIFMWMEYRFSEFGFDVHRNEQQRKHSLRNPLPCYLVIRFLKARISTQREFLRGTFRTKQHPDSLLQKRWSGSLEQACKYHGFGLTRGNLEWAQKSSRGWRQTLGQCRSHRVRVHLAHHGEMVNLKQPNFCMICLLLVASFSWKHHFPQRETGHTFRL